MGGRSPSTSAASDTTSGRSKTVPRAAGAASSSARSSRPVPPPTSQMLPTPARSTARTTSGPATDESDRMAPSNTAPASGRSSCTQSKNGLPNAAVAAESPARSGEMAWFHNSHCQSADMKRTQSRKDCSSSARRARDRASSP